MCYIFHLVIYKMYSVKMAITAFAISSTLLMGFWSA